MQPCDFCNREGRKIIAENDDFYSFFDHYPVNPGHALVVPKEHYKEIEDIPFEKVHNMIEVIRKTRRYIYIFYDPDGFNVGMNLGYAAGQTINHLHFHIIPRYKGDVPDPRGGIRGVIPNKKLY